VYVDRGHNPTCDDRLINIKRTGLGLFDGHDDAGEYVDGAGEHTSGGGGDHNGGTDASEQIEGCGQEEECYTFTPMRLEGDYLVAWLKAAREHPSWKACEVEDLSWNGTAMENTEKYRREVGIHEENL